MILFIVGIVLGFVLDHYIFRSGMAGVVTQIEEEFVKVEETATKQTRALIVKIRALL